METLINKICDKKSKICNKIISNITCECNFFLIRHALDISHYCEVFNILLKISQNDQKCKI